MKAFLMAAAVVFAAPAHAQWTDVDGGKKHDATGLICPVMASGFELKDAAGDDLSDMRYVVQHRVLKGDASGVTECTSYEITSVHPRAELGRSLGWVMDTRTGAIDTAPTPVVREGAHAPRGTDSTRSQESAHVVNH